MDFQIRRSHLCSLSDQDHWMHDRLSGSWCRAVYSVVGKGRKRRDGIESKGRDITRFKYSRRHEVGGGESYFYQTMRC